MNELISQPALHIVELLNHKEVLPSELIDIVEQQCQLIEPQTNALVTTCFERARNVAQLMEKQPISKRGILAGLPVSIKDLNDVAGVRTTVGGSLLYQDHIPEVSDGMVSQIEKQSGIVYAMSNAPEFGTGGHTFNEIFGVTRNPWDLSKSAGGSSGGAAASLASGTSWLSSGSDNAGSLRTPASFCGVVGLRPTPFLIPNGCKSNFETLPVNGPMARNVTDAALFLDAMVFHDKECSFAANQDKLSYLNAAKKPNHQVKIGFSSDLGLKSVNKEVSSCVEQAMVKLQKQGLNIRHVDFSLEKMNAAYRTLRSLGYATSYGDMTKAERTQLKKENNIEIDLGMALTGSQISQAQRQRDLSYQNIIKLFDEFDVLICPATNVLPFATSERYYGFSQGVDYPNYLDWLSISYVLTALAVPIVAMPCAMSVDGLPVGIQVIGRPNSESQLISAAVAIEQAIGNWSHKESPIKTLVKNTAHQS